MFHEHTREKYWICIFVIYVPTVVQTLSECRKVDVCKCSTDEGTIDLWSLAGTGSNIPRFKHITVKGSGGDHFTVDWNPCNKWTKPSEKEKQNNNCENVAVCLSFGGLLLADVGDQETADFSFNATTGTCVLSFVGKAIPSNPGASSSTRIILQCDHHEEGKLESVTESVTSSTSVQIPLTLRSKYACPVKSGLSTGSILIIIFVSLLVVYLVTGILFNKYHKGATGKEVIPNISFWTDFPLLVKDGAVFSYHCCKNICCRKRSSYASI